MPHEQDDHDHDDQAEQDVGRDTARLLDSLPDEVPEEHVEDPPADAAGGVGGQEDAVAQLGHAGEPRDHGAQEGGEATHEDGDRAAPAQLVQCAGDPLLAFAQRAELEQLVTPAIADGVPDGVAHNGAHHDDSDDATQVDATLGRQHAAEYGGGLAGEDEPEHDRVLREDEQADQHVGLPPVQRQKWLQQPADHRRAAGRGRLRSARRARHTAKVS